MKVIGPRILSCGGDRRVELPQVNRGNRPSNLNVVLVSEASADKARRRGEILAASLLATDGATMSDLPRKDRYRLIRDAKAGEMR